AAAGDYRQRLQSRRRALPVTGTRRVSKRHMLYNQANPHIAIDPHTADIRINGEALPPLPTPDVPPNRPYLLLSEPLGPQTANPLRRRVAVADGVRPYPWVLIVDARSWSDAYPGQLFCLDVHFISSLPVRQGNAYNQWC